MVIQTKLFSEIADKELLDKLKLALSNDHKLNLNFLKDRGWSGARLDDIQILDEDALFLEQALVSIGHSRIFSVWVDNVIGQDSLDFSVQEIEVNKGSIEELQNPYNDFTMSNSIIFTLPDLDFLILCPRTRETDLLISGSPEFIRIATKGKGWMDLKI